MAYKSLFVIAVATITVAHCNVYNNNRIVGGDPTTIDRYPSIVQVESSGLFGLSWSQSCAASVLNEKYIVSAAHCFVGFIFSINNRRIRAGTTFRNSGGTIAYLTRAHNHPSYRSGLSFDGDISVIEITNLLQLSNVIQPVTIVYQGFELNDGSPVVHAGWGATSQGGPASSTLRDVTIYTVNHDICRERYLRQLIPQRVTVNMICAGILDVGGKDACQGDSGGPLYFGNNLVGIVSWGRGCADAHFPGVSTKLASYTNWIVETAV